MPCKIVRVGTVTISMFNGAIRTIIDVRHVSELKQNLVSLSTLDLKSYKFFGKGGVLKVYLGAIVVMMRYRTSIDLYILQCSTVIGDAAVSTYSLVDEEVTKLWHTRFEHMSENGMT